MRKDSDTEGMTPELEKLLIMVVAGDCEMVKLLALRERELLFLLQEREWEWEREWWEREREQKRKREHNDAATE